MPLVRYELVFPFAGGPGTPGTGCSAGRLKPAVGWWTCAGPNLPSPAGRVWATANGRRHRNR